MSGGHGHTTSATRSQGRHGPRSPTNTGGLGWPRSISDEDEPVPRAGEAPAFQLMTSALLTSYHPGILSSSQKNDR